MTEKKKFKELYKIEARSQFFDNWSKKFENKIFVVAETYQQAQLPFFSEVFKIEPNA